MGKEQKDILNEIQKLIEELEIVYHDPITKKEIEQIEKELNLKFPKEYVDFLMMYSFLYVGVGYLGGKEGRAETMKMREVFPDLFPKNLLVLNENGSGDYYCLVCGGENNGKVIFWQHDVGEESIYPNVPDGKDEDFWIETSNMWLWLLDTLKLQKEIRDELYSGLK